MSGIGDVKSREGVVIKLHTFVLSCSPWEDLVYQDSVEKNSTGALTINGFLSQVSRAKSEWRCFGNVEF